MTHLRERLTDLATTDAPPSRLTAEGLYTMDRRRRHRRAFAVTGALGAVLAITAAAAVAKVPGTDAAEPGRGATPSAARPDLLRDGDVTTAVALDALHLYALVIRCTPDKPVDCHQRRDLYGSDDGGLTWTVRDRGLVGELVVYRPDRLSIVNPWETGKTSTSVNVRRWDSRDGGRTWAQVTTRTDTRAVAEVPDGGWLGGNREDCRAPGDRCLVAYRADGTSRAPLANQPPLANAMVLDMPDSAGLWVLGWEPANGRYGVASSLDRGRTWSPVFVPGAEEPGYLGCRPEDMDIRVASLDGRTAYLVVMCPESTSRSGIVYRTDDGGGDWRRTDPGHTLPYYYTGARSYLAADGTHVVQLHVDDPARWWTSRDGGRSYQPAAIRGLHAGLSCCQIGESGVTVVAPGTYFAYDHAAVYRSSDGIDWTRFPMPASTPGR